MKKTYEAPEILTVILQQQDMLAQSITGVDGGDTGIGGGGQSGEGEGFGAKEHNIWDEEW